MTRKTKSKKPKPGRPQSSDSEDARELLLRAAVPLFAKKGFDGTSVKDIADRAGVNVSLVSYHFNGKEGLYKSCLEQFGKNRLAATERLLQPPQTLEECRLRLEMFIDDMMVWFEEEPDLCAIVQREADMGFQIARDVFESTFLKVFMTFMAFIKTGQTKGFLRRDVDPEIATRFYFIGLTHMIQKDDLAKRTFGVSIQDPSYRKKLKVQVCQIFFEGLGQITGAKNARGVKK
jgi:AcrR family transcriptional regulator